MLSNFNIITLFPEIFKNWLDIVKPKKAYLSHMTAHLDYKATSDFLLNPNYMAAFDGQVIEIK